MAEATLRLTDRERELLTALKRSIAAMNLVPQFRTDEGIRSYQLLSQLDAVVRKFEGPPVPGIINDASQPQTNG